MTPFYERTHQRLMQHKAPSRRIAMVWDGKLLRGLGSLHQTDGARRMRMFWRIKTRRGWSRCMPRSSVLSGSESGSLQKMMCF